MENPTRRLGEEAANREEGRNNPFQFPISVWKKCSEWLPLSLAFAFLTHARLHMGRDAPLSSKRNADAGQRFLLSTYNVPGRNAHGKEEKHWLGLQSSLLAGLCFLCLASCGLRHTEEEIAFALHLQLVIH
ncbi:hypothetical protein AVEN_16878-1 [Araneus ventricosus]|uniref:Uncharacterized protein n=1 Tax=Araneus ventricosus TaxID=182803 RepID=A0A4Y2KRV8_ARAVE|nr:hypothetical protein AVEN_16878-1 [Araneus ventricosus]